MQLFDVTKHVNFIGKFNVLYHVCYCLLYHFYKDENKKVLMSQT